MRFLLWLLWSAPVFAQLQFIGFGPTAWLPWAEAAKSMRLGYGGSVVVGTRQYCQLWGLVGLHHYQLRTRDSTEISLRPLPPRYRELTSLEVALRFFPWHPTRVPLYAQVGLLPNAIAASDSASPIGLGTSLGVGVVFPFSDPCCSWFLELSGQYALWNVLLRDDLRPILRSWLVGLSVRVAL